MKITMMGTSISHPKISVEHASIDRIAGLQFLLHYALHYHHSRAWVGPITLLLARWEGAHG